MGIRCFAPFVLSSSPPHRATLQSVACREGYDVVLVYNFQQFCVLVIENQGCLCREILRGSHAWTVTVYQAPASALRTSNSDSFLFGVVRYVAQDVNSFVWVSSLKTLLHATLRLGRFRFVFPGMLCFCLLMLVFFRTEGANCSALLQCSLAEPWRTSPFR